MLKEEMVVFLLFLYLQWAVEAVALIIFPFSNQVVAGVRGVER